MAVTGSTGLFMGSMWLLWDVHPALFCENGLAWLVRGKGISMTLQTNSQEYKSLKIYAVTFKISD